MMSAIFILSHQRVDRVETYSTIESSGANMDNVFVVIDDEDTQRISYLERFGEHLIVFNKQTYIEAVDTLETEKLRASAVYARNAVEDIALSKGLDAFVVFDDDITNLRYRYIENYIAKSQALKSNLDEVFRLYVDYLLDANIATLSSATVMVYAGGVHSEADIRRLASHRYTCQIHIRNLSFPVDWISLANNDSISANNTAKIGYLWWALPFIVYDSPKMNTLPGGMKEVYDSVSEFKRAFMSTVVSPAVCRVGCSKDRLAIKRDLKAAHPMIVSSRWKK
jgi:hypothetical protein